MSEFDNYHTLRGNDIHFINDSIPNYIIDILPFEKTSRIIDIGCGNGSFLIALKKLGYNNVYGIDLDDDVLEVARKHGVSCDNQDALTFFPDQKFDVVYMSHVLEHLPKEMVIPFVTHVRENILSDKGVYIVKVPNAQSNTNCYWAYEDFTHNTLFTSGSLDYVLKAAGFINVIFLDPDGTADSRWFGKIIKKPLIAIYKFKNWFWNQVTESAYHSASKVIYTWELKAVAYKQR